MNTPKTLVYDGSFNGFLTAVYTAFEKKMEILDIQGKGLVQNGLFSETETIITHIDKAKRVWTGIRNKSYHALTNIYFSFLGEREGIERLLLDYIKKIMGTTSGTPFDFVDDNVQYIAHLANKVAKEKQKIEALLGFGESMDGVMFAMIAPEFDVLPLISKYCKAKYPDQEWLVYDGLRNYAIYYNLKGVEMVGLDLGDFYNSPLLQREMGRKNVSASFNLWPKSIVTIALKPKINRDFLVKQWPKRQYAQLSPKREAV